MEYLSFEWDEQNLEHIARHDVDDTTSIPMKQRPLSITTL
jgi:hypothetical protein